jgi:hypothetical protein
MKALKVIAIVLLALVSCVAYMAVPSLVPSKLVFHAYVLFGCVMLGFGLGIQRLQVKS